MIARVRALVCLFCVCWANINLGEHISTSNLNMTSPIDPATRKKVLRVVFFSLLLDLVRDIPRNQPLVDSYSSRVVELTSN